MAIQTRRGAYNDFDPDKMLPGEIATVTSGDPGAEDGRSVYACFAAGDVKRMATYEDMQENIDNATQEVQEKFTAQLTQKISQANTAISNAQTVTSAANTAAQGANTAKQEALDAADEAREYVLGDISQKTVTFEQASDRENINSGESTATLFGKIKKWFADLGAAAFQAVANNLTTTAEGSVLDARQGKVLGDAINQLNTKLSDGGSGYVRIPDGTMIQYGFFGGTALTNDYKNATRQVDFPHEFSDTAPVSVQVTLATTQYLSGCSIDNITVSGFRAILMGASAANTTYDSGFRWIAIGRWK